MEGKIIIIIILFPVTHETLSINKTLFTNISLKKSKTHQAESTVYMILTAYCLNSFDC